MVGIMGCIAQSYFVILAYLGTDLLLDLFAIV